MKHLKWLVLAAAALTLVPVYASQRKPDAKPAAAAARPITVYRTATCGCCAKWVDHLKEHGFTPTVHIVENTSVTPPGKGLPDTLRSCHSATVDGYSVEGHVPGDVVLKLLKERPKVRGIAVPGMPAGSPGMEVPSGEVEAYDTLLIGNDGATTVYSEHGRP